MDEGAVITETNLQFTIISLWLVNAQKNFRKIIFKVLTAISCPLNALDMPTKISLRNILHC